MAIPPDLTERAKVKRDLAARTRRWARGLSLAADRDRLSRHAEELEREASELERQAEAQAIPTMPSPTVVQMQQQPQQQQEADPKGAHPEDEKREK